MQATPKIGRTEFTPEGTRVPVQESLEEKLSFAESQARFCLEKLEDSHLTHSARELYRDSFENWVKQIQRLKKQLQKAEVAL